MSFEEPASPSHLPLSRILRCQHLHMGFAEKSFYILRRDLLIHGTQIVTGAVIARSLGPAAMGLWIILLMIPSYAEPIGRLQVDTASVYALGTGKYRLGEVAFALLVITLLSAGLVVGLFLLNRNWLFRTFLAEAAGVPQYVYLMLAYFPVKFVVLNYSYLLLFLEDVRGFNTVALLLNLVPSVSGALLVWATNLSILGLVLSLLGGAIAALTYAALRIHKVEPLIVHANLPLMKELLLFGLRLYFLSLIAYFHVYVSSLLVVLYLPPQEVAFFRLGQERALLLTKIPSAVGTLLYTRVARLADEPEKARALAATSFRLTFLLLLVIGALGAAIAKPAIWMLYGSAFEGVVLPLSIFIPAVIADTSSGLLTQYFVGRGRLGILLAMATISLLTQVTLLSLAVPRWSVVGAACSILAVYLVTMAMRIAVFSATEGGSLRELLLFQRGDIAFLWGVATSQFQSAMRLVLRQGAAR